MVETFPELEICAPEDQIVEKAREQWYRYVDDFWVENMAGFHLETWVVYRTTPKGVWLGYNNPYKFVLREARKRFACPTMEEAMQSYRARKARQILLLSSQLKAAKAQILLAALSPPIEKRPTNREIEQAWSEVEHEDHLAKVAIAQERRAQKMLGKEGPLGPLSVAIDRLPR